MVPSYNYFDFLKEETSFSNLLSPFEIKKYVGKTERTVKVKIEVAYFDNKLPY
jgi:hypothetical protein